MSNGPRPPFFAPHHAAKVHSPAKQRPRVIGSCLSDIALSACIGLTAAICLYALVVWADGTFWRIFLQEALFVSLFVLVVFGLPLLLLIAYELIVERFGER